MKDGLRLEVATIPEKLQSISLPKKHHSQQINFQHKETTLPVRPPKGKQPRSEAICLVKFIRDEKQSFSATFSFVLSGGEPGKNPLLLFISTIVFYLISGHLPCARFNPAV